MMHPKDIRIESYDYSLPDERIARCPLEERDASKLLLYQMGRITEARYHDLPNHLPLETLLVFNQTKVVHARLLFKKPTGGVIEIFCLEPHEQYSDVQTAMLQQQKVWWQCMIGGASKWKHGAELEQKYAQFDLALSAKIVERQTGTFTIELSWKAAKQLSFAEVLNIAGEVPLPPYLNREAESADEERYQTVYAKDEGSVAAPTAGLHFTDTMMEKLLAKDIHQSFVTLHVGAGTFKPVTSETISGHEMHAEWMDVSIQLVQQLIAHLEKGIVAVGTTSLRTVESLYWIGARLLQHAAPVPGNIAVTQWEPYETQADGVTAAHALQAVVEWLLKNHQQRLITRTQIIIVPGYEFKIVKGLITNFHQPKSTLLLLVAALIGDDWHKVYEYALANDFRFLSFGDGSLLWASKT